MEPWRRRIIGSAIAGFGAGTIGGTLYETNIVPYIVGPLLFIIGLIIVGGRKQ